MIGSEQETRTWCRKARDLVPGCSLAIVGGIVASYQNEDAIPPAWKDACEPLPAWVF